MALGDCHRASVDAEAYARASKDVVLEIKIVNFINEFLFTQTDDCTRVVVPRHRVNRNKRYRAMWRSAVKSLLKKYSDCGLNQAQGGDTARAPRKGSNKAITPMAHSKPDYQCVEFRNIDDHSKAINCVPDTGNEESLVSSVGSPEAKERSCADECFFKASTVPTTCRKCRNFNQQAECLSADLNYFSLGSFAAQKKDSTCSFCLRTLEEQAIAQCPQVSIMETYREPLHSGTPKNGTILAKTAHATVTPSRQKPPRPPRSHSLSNLSQVSLVKTVRRARPFNTGSKRKYSPAFGSNASSLWAWIVTLCFAGIIMIQGFAGHTTSGEAFLKAAAGREARTPQAIHGDSQKVSPDLDISSPNLGSRIGGPILQRRGGSISHFMDKVQWRQLEVPQSGYAEGSSEKKSSSN